MLVDQRPCIGTCNNNRAAAKSKDNPYTRPEVGKYYRCGELEHKSNECSKRMQFNMADYEDDEEGEFEIEEPNNFDFADVDTSKRQNLR